MRPLAIISAFLACALIGCASEDGPTQPDIAANPTLAAAAAPLVFREVSAGIEWHTCGVTTTNRAYCWGINGDPDGVGPLGDGTDVGLRSRPTAVVGGLSFRQVTGGMLHSCGVTTDDRAYCWGAGSTLGTGTGANTTRPVPVTGGLGFRAVEAGSIHTCGLTTAGKAYCWGLNGFGQLGDGTTRSRNVPVAVLGNHTFSQISASWEHTCALKASGEAWCWGANRFGQLGIGNTISRKQRPTKVVGGLAFARISAGGRQQRGTTCAVTTENRAYCWGNGIQGERGDGTSGEKQFVPKAVAGAQTFDRIAVGYDHTCGVTTGNQAWCWGNNVFGGLGDGTTTLRRIPVRVSGGLAFARLSTGARLTCATTMSGAGYCWGSGSNGALGNGGTADRSVPTAVAGPL
jgi:alpha-tubulin suppressor-like RCC1 family protein